MIKLRGLEKQRRKWTVRSYLLSVELARAFNEKHSYELAIAARKAGPGWTRNRVGHARHDD
jgi:hypothetical protein